MTIIELRDKLNGLINANYGDYEARSEAEAGCVMTIFVKDRGDIINDVHKYIIVAAD